METKKCKQCEKELPIQEFSKNAYGYTSICKSCNSHNRSEAAKKRNGKIVRDYEQEIEKAKQLRLSEFTPRELIIELRKRGYEGTLRYVEVHEINIEKIS